MWQRSNKFEIFNPDTENTDYGTRLMCDLHIRSVKKRNRNCLTMKKDNLQQSEIENILIRAK